MRLASKSLGSRLKIFGRHGLDRLYHGELKSAVMLGLLRRPGKWVTLSVSVTAMGMTVGMAVAGNGGPGFDARAVSCTSAPAALDVGCDDEPKSGAAARPAAPDDGTPGRTPPMPTPSGLTVSDGRPATVGTGSTTGGNAWNGGGDYDDDNDSGEDDEANNNNNNDDDNDNDDDDDDHNGNGNGNGDGDDDGDEGPSLSSSTAQPLFSLPNLAAGRTVERCISVTYEGSDPATVGLHATRGGTGLDGYLNVDVVRGQMPPAANGGCTGFQPDATDHVGRGPGVLYRGRLSAFPSAAPNGVSAGTPWQDGDAHAYKIRLSLESADMAQGLSVFFDFVWSAQS